MPIVWLDGRYLDERRARIPVGDPALLWGSGLFEVLRAYGGRPFRVADHVERLRRSARHFGLDASRVPDLARVVPRLLERNRLDGGRVRVVLTGGGRVFVEVRPADRPPRGLYTRGATLAVAPWRRDPASPLAGHKTLNYLELALTREAAARRGAVDALILDTDGRVLEGTRSNVFAVARGRLVAPHAPRGVLPGVTRGVVLELAREIGLETRDERITLRTLQRADEVLVTSTMLEVAPVARVGDARVGPPGPVTGVLRKAYGNAVVRECGSHR